MYCIFKPITCFSCKNFKSTKVTGKYSWQLDVVEYKLQYFSLQGSWVPPQIGIDRKSSSKVEILYLKTVLNFRTWVNVLFPHYQARCVLLSLSLRASVLLLSSSVTADAPLQPILGVRLVYYWRCWCICSPLFPLEPILWNWSCYAFCAVM